MAEDREELIERWERMAPGWKATRASFQHIVEPVSHWMVDAIDPQPGQRILELAAGVGDTGLLAAERVGPEGSVLITDATEGMVAAARERAEEVGATNVELRTMQAEWIDLPAASVDGALCRFGYMLLVDPEAALRETRRVLKPGGRVALAVWDDLAKNPWMGVMRRALADAGIALPDGGPGPFALGSEEAVEELLETAGFDDIVIEGLDLDFAFPSVDAWWDHTMQTSGSMVQAVEALSPADHYKLRDLVDAGYAPYVRDDGSLHAPARALVAAAGA